MAETADAGSVPAGPTTPAGTAAAVGRGRRPISRELVRELQLAPLSRRYGPTTIAGWYALVNGFVAIGIMAAVAFVTDQPFVFPSLGATAFLLFATPLLPTASPRNAICGHAVGAVAGYLSLVAFGLRDDAPALAAGVGGAHVAAAAVSLGVTSGVMVWMRFPHPPACATTLIVSLGVLREVGDLAVLMLAVVLLLAQAVAINRIAGVPYPLWAAKEPTP